MGLGRRRFIKLANTALIGLTVDPFKSVITNNDFYVNKKMGIIFEKPSNWVYLNVMDFEDIKENQILGNGWNDKKEELWEELGDPICYITRYDQSNPKYEGLFSPTITLNVTHKSKFDDFGIDSFDELMELSQLGTSEILRDFKVTKRRDIQNISGYKFYEYDAQYLFEHVKLDKPFKVELKVLKAEHNNFFYEFNCHQSIEQNQIATADFEQFKQSIKLI